jgi:hypothetical protein
MGYAIATGFEMSPLLLPRFAPRWGLVDVPGTGGATWPSVTDGTTSLVPLDPGVVAWRPEVVPHERMLASLEAARTSPHDPLPLDGAAVRIVVIVDDAVRAAASRETARFGGGLPPGLLRVEASVTAGSDLLADVKLVHSDAAAAASAVTLLKQLEVARQLGLLSLLGGPEAALLSALPALSVAQEGTEVRLRLTLQEQDVRRLLEQVLALPR